ncbi:MAG: hypothetical protein Kow00121_45640 [Elainellaceae cyanobacterium]
MAQIFDPLPSDASDSILCCYVNATSKIQIVRITNIQNWYFERVIFPGQRLVFEALPHAQLEVHCGMMASAILADTIPCDRLRVAAELEADFEIEVVSRSPEATSKEPVATSAES